MAISCCVIGRRGETNWTWAVYYFPTTLCGVLVFDSVSRVPPPPASSPSRLLPPFTTIFHIQLCHTPSFTYSFFNHHLSHTTLSTTIFHIQLCHTPSFTHNHFTIIHTQLGHTQLCHVALCVAGVAQPHIHLRFAWQAGRRGTHGTGHLLSLCVAGVALGDIHRHLAWQAWHLATSTFVSRGRRGTYGTGLALVARLGGLGDAAALYVADVALGDIHLHLAWQAWHLVTSTFAL